MVTHTKTLFIDYRPTWTLDDVLLGAMFPTAYAGLDSDAVFLHTRAPGVTRITAACLRKLEEQSNTLTRMFADQRSVKHEDVLTAMWVISDSNPDVRVLLDPDTPAGTRRTAAERLERTILREASWGDVLRRIQAAEEVVYLTPIERRRASLRRYYEKKKARTAGLL